MRRRCSCCGERRTDTVVTVSARPSGAVYDDRRGGLGSRSRTLCEPCALHALALIRDVLDSLEAP